MKPMNSRGTQVMPESTASGRWRTKLTIASGIEKYASAMTASAPTIDHSTPGRQVMQ